MFFLLIIACKSSPSQYIQTKEGKLMPNIAACAERNFPKVAKPYVSQVLVEMKIKVDKEGIVRFAEPQRVLFRPNTDRHIAELVTPHFERAGIESLLNRQCPIHYENGEPKPYMLVVPLSYELVNQ